MGPRKEIQIKKKPTIESKNAQLTLFSDTVEDEITKIQLNDQSNTENSGKSIGQSLGNILKYITNFLKKRQFQIRISNNLSNTFRKKMVVHNDHHRKSLSFS